MGIKRETREIVTGSWKTDRSSGNEFTVEFLKKVLADLGEVGIAGPSTVLKFEPAYSDITSFPARFVLVSVHNSNVEVGK